MYVRAVQPAPPTHQVRTECHECDGHGYCPHRYALLRDGYLSTAITTRPCRQHHDNEDGWLTGFVPPL
jgi:hypothetical protein